MKTFKLKNLEIVANEEEGIAQKKIKIHDGLVINREDEIGWLVEAFIDRSYKPYFEAIKHIKEIMIQAKITRVDNDPAFFITQIISVNEIGEDKLNVLFQGKVVDNKSRIEEMLREILNQGYQGESLLKKFKEMI